jgi:hypothetical protein
MASAVCANEAILTMPLAPHSLSSIATDIGFFERSQSIPEVRSPLDLTHESSTDDVSTKSSVCSMTFALNVDTALIWFDPVQLERGVGRK